jgi:hypothetical protein
MNMTEVIHDIKRTNGLHTLALPYDKPLETILKGITQISIRTFSQFKPLKKEGYAFRRDLVTPPGNHNGRAIVKLPSFLTTSHVHYAKAFPESAHSVEHSHVAGVAVVSPFVGFGACYPQDMFNAGLMGSTANKYVGITTREPTSDWLGYNKLELFNFARDAYIRFECKCCHDLNGETIPDSCMESFKQLAELDIQRTLHADLINMVDVGSVHKSLQIKIDQWAGAADKREALIEKWDSVFHIDDLDNVVFF